MRITHAFVWAKVSTGCLFVGYYNISVSVAQYFLFFSYLEIGFRACRLKKRLTVHVFGRKMSLVRLASYNFRPCLSLIYLPSYPTSFAHLNGHEDCKFNCFPFSSRFMQWNYVPISLLCSPLQVHTLPHKHRASTCYYIFIIIIRTKNDTVHLHRYTSIYFTQYSFVWLWIIYSVWIDVARLWARTCDVHDDLRWKSELWATRFYYNSIWLYAVRSVCTARCCPLATRICEWLGMMDGLHWLPNEMRSGGRFD